MVTLDATASVRVLLSAPTHDGAGPPARLAARAAERAGAHAAPEDASEVRLEQWFRAHFSKLWRFVARLGTPSGIIDDVVQDAFIAASRRHGDILDGREWPFLVGTALRLAANHRLRASVRREVADAERIDDEASPLPSAEQLLIDKRARQELERVLSALPDAQRAVFVLYELEGFSAPEIAELTGLPLGTVASRLGRARIKFSEAAGRVQRARLARREKP